MPIKAVEAKSFLNSNNLFAQNQREYVIAKITRTSTSICHCGAVRNETEYESIRFPQCPTHGTGCTLYSEIWVRTYFYCTNPNCGDNYYSEWRFSSSSHL